MSLVERKPVNGISDQVSTNRAVLLQKMARGLKFRIYDEEGLYYPCSGNKGAATAKLICVFVSAYAKSRFSHDEVQIEPTILYTATAHSVYDNQITRVRRLIRIVLCIWQNVDYRQRSLGVPSVIILNFLTNKSGQTVQTQIRLQEQFDQGLHCLLFHLRLCYEIP